MTQITKQKIDIAKASDLLKEFELRRTKAIEKGDQLIALAKQGLTAEIDTQLNAYNVALRNTVKSFNDQRSPLTKQMDAVKKLFVAEENALKAKSNEVQQYRNDYAKQVHDENQAKQKEAETQRLAKSELAELNAEIEKQLNAYVQLLVDTLKKGMLNGLSTVTDKNIDSKRIGLASLVTELDPAKYSEFNPKVVSKFGHDVQALKKVIMEAKSESLHRHYQTEIAQYKQECQLVMNNILDNEENKADFIDNQEKQIAIDSANASEVANVAIDVNKEAAQADAAFDSVVVVDEAPEARKGYSIVTKTREDYNKIIASWVAYCSAALPINSFEKKTIGSMVKDLEKLAHSKGTKVDGLVYNEVFKAVNRAS